MEFFEDGLELCIPVPRDGLHICGSRDGLERCIPVSRDGSEGCIPVSRDGSDVSVSRDGLDVSGSIQLTLQEHEIKEHTLYCRF